MTGVAHWPERGSPETRRAIQSLRDSRDPIRVARRTIISIHAAERELQSASLVVERRQALAAVDAGLRSLHASRIAAVVSRFADRRAALAMMTDPGARAAAGQQIAMEEANELARLAVEHAGEKRRLRHSVLASLRGNQRAVRRNLRQRQRHQRAGFAIQLHALRPKATDPRSNARASTLRAWHAPRLPPDRS